MTDKELKNLVASLAISQKETDKDLKKLFAEVTAAQKETDKQIKETNRQIGGIANKFGTFTEGLALPSIEKIMREKFKIENIAQNVKAKNGNDKIEIDVLAYANSKINQIFVIEIKSKVRDDSFTQLQNIISKFFKLFPQHNDKKLFAMLAGVDISEEHKKRVFDNGWYYANVHDNIFSLDIPKNFKPKGFLAAK